MNKELSDWLLSSNPWTKYRTSLDLLTINDKNEIAALKEELINDLRIREIISELKDWYPESYSRHNDPKISHYRLMMLGELGLDISDSETCDIIKKVKEYRDEGSFAMKQQLPVKAGVNLEGWHALPCDSPIILYSLLLLGDRSDVTIKAVEVLANKWREPSGWFCHLFFVRSQFKKLRAACPMAGLMALSVFSLFDEYKDSISSENAFNSLTFHKDHKKSLYYFGRSKKFWTIKYPFVWYNALYMADVVSRYPQFHNSDLAVELFDWVRSSFDEKGMIKPTSMFRIYKEWDFADKKNPSPWLTFICHRILKRIG